MWKGIKKIFYDLFISLLVSAISKFFWRFFISKTIDLSFFSKNSFYLLWVGIFLLILFLHISVPIISRKFIDKKQKDSIPFTVIQNYEGKTKIDYKGFTWEVFFNFPPYVQAWEHYNEDENYDLNKLKGAYFGEVEGPYCPNDKRKINTSRTTLGFYKYKCPKCGYKKKSSKNLYTFQEETLDEIRSKFR
ncbi:hypothetical protein [Staphylococcus aureus]|uniref:hypothetical protein n=1 Tax=Staphylococcus aureus TaxID=1280 RepID=UPI000F22FE79|nr:hypothetical protein [Staphylococcus aureus]RLL59878.1 hypothetical protein D8063_11450 [Staphylococcus aureus]